MDQIDRKILFTIAESAREPHSLLAKKIKISREVFDYRLKKLEEQKIIRGYQARINLKNFIYGGYIVLIQIVSLNEEKEIINLLKKNQTIYYIEKCGGSFDYIVGVNVNSLTEFSKSIDFINDTLGKNKTNMIILTMIKELRDSFKPLFSNKEEFNNIITELDLIKKEPVDKIDKDLIIELGKDATISSPKLSEKIGITEVAIRQRIKRLINKKIILGFRTMIDLGNLDLQVSSLLIKTNAQSSDLDKKLQGFFQLDKNNTFVCKVIGQYNYFVTVFSKDNLGLKEYITKLRNNFPDLITNIDILHLFELTYHRHVPFDNF